MTVVVKIDRGAFLQLGTSGGSVYQHFIRLGARIDARSKQVMSGTLVKVRTGNLRSSQGPPVVHPAAAGVIRGELTNRARYALFVHEGTRAHDIEPRNARMLRFPGVDGQPVFRRIVHHPGTESRPFLSEPMREIITAG